jgi:tetratricopeptide (TPR) repeat protein/TolB-like protein
MANDRVDESPLPKSLRSEIYEKGLLRGMERARRFSWFHLLFLILALCSILTDCPAQVTSDDVVGWDLTTGKAPPSKSAMPAVGQFVWSTDRKSLAIGAQQDVRVEREGQQEAKYSLERTEGTISAIALSSGGRLLAVATSSGSLIVWSGQTTPVFKTGANAALTTTLAFSGDDGFLAAGGASLRLWETRTWRRTGPEVPARSWFTALAFNPRSGDLAAAEFDGTVQVFGSQGERKKTYTAASGSVTTMSYSGSGNLLATGGADGAVKLWKPSEDAPTAVLTQSGAVRSICFSPNEAIVAIASDDRKVTTWNLAAARLLRTLALESGSASGLIFADDTHIEIGLQASAPQRPRTLFILSIAGRREQNGEEDNAIRNEVVSFADGVEASGRGDFGRIARQVLLNPPNVEVVRTTLEQWMKQMQSQDQFVLCYAGEIASTQSGPGLKLGGGGSISSGQLSRWLESMPVKNQLIVLDADHAEEMQDDLRRLLLPERKSKGLDQKNRLFIARKGVQERAHTEQNTLASVVVAGLQGQADGPVKDGKISAAALQGFLYNHLLAASGPGAPLQAAIELDGDDFTLAEATAAKQSVPRGSKWLGTPSTPRPEELFQNRHDYALLIATNKYDSWPELSNPIPDAEAIRDTLQDMYGFQVQLLTNPTASEIIQTLVDYNRKEYQPGDQLFVFVAGHGDFDHEAGEGFIVASDSKLATDDPTRGTLIPHSRLRNYIDNLKVKHVLVVMDVCFGGTFDRKLSEAGSRGGMYEKLPIQQLFAERDKWPTRKFITSGGETYVPDGEPGHHSPFVKNFLQELRGPPGSPAYLTFADLLSSVGATSPVPVWGSWGQDEAGSDFFLISKAVVVQSRSEPPITAIKDSEPIGQVVINQRRSVCVLGLKNLSMGSGDGNLGDVITEQLSGELGAGQKLLVVPSQTVSDTKLSLGLQEEETYSADALLRVHQNTGADVVVAGSIYAPKGAGGVVRVSFTIQDAVTGAIIDSAPMTGTEAGLGDLISRAGAMLRLKLGVSDISAQQVAEIKAGMPTTMDALRLYSEAMDRLHHYDAVAARDLLLKADTAEPGVAFVHVGLANAWELLGYDAKAIDEAKAAATLAAGLPKEAQYAIEALTSELAGQLPRAIKAYTFLQMSNPDDLEYGLKLAHAQSDGGHGEDALASLEVLTKLPQPRGNDPRILVEQAYAQEQLGMFPAAQEAAQNAIESARKIQARLVEAEASLRLCWVERNLGAGDRAVEACENAAQIYTAVGNKVGMARAQTGLGNALSDKPDYSGALAKYEEAAEITNSIGARGDHAGALLNVARVQMDLSRPEDAAKSLEEVIATAREIGDVTTEGKGYVNLSAVAKMSGDTQRARDLMEQALRIAESANDQDAISRAQSNMATFQLEGGDLRAALVSADHCIEIRTRIENISGIAYCQLTRGDILMAQGDLDSSRAAYTAAEALYAKAQQAGDLAVTWVSLAHLSAEAGQLAEAETSAREAWEEFRKEKDVEMQAASLTVLAEALVSQGKKDEAKGALDQLRLLKFKDAEQALETAIAEARYLALVGSYDESLARLQQTLEQSLKAGNVGLELQIRLEICRVRAKAGRGDGQEAEVKALSTEASQRGFGLIARESAELHP